MKGNQPEPGLRIAMASYDIRELRVHLNYLAQQDGFALCQSYRCGSELLEALEAGRAYDIILLDEQLADMTASDFVVLLGRCRLPCTPLVVLLSSWGQTENSGAGLHPAANYCIMNPYSLSSLSHGLRMLYGLTAGQTSLLCAKLYNSWGARTGDVSCDYLTEAVKIVLKSERKMAIRKEILQQVGERHNVSISAADSGIRRMIEWLDEQNTPAWQAFKAAHGFTDKKLTTGKFIYAVKAHLLQQRAGAAAEGGSHRDEPASESVYSSL